MILRVSVYLYAFKKSITITIDSDCTLGMMYKLTYKFV